jgi:hypothetical protein
MLTRSAFDRGTVAPEQYGISGRERHSRGPSMPTSCSGRPRLNPKGAVHSAVISPSGTANQAGILEERKARTGIPAGLFHDPTSSRSRVTTITGSLARPTPFWRCRILAMRFPLSGRCGSTCARHQGSVGQQSGIPTGRADAFPVELLEPEAPVPVGPDMVEPTVVSGAFSDDDTPAEVEFFPRMMLLLTSQHCLGVTP